MKASLLIAFSCFCIALFTTLSKNFACRSQEVEFLPAWTAENGSFLNSPFFHPASGGVACFGLQNFDVEKQQAECVFLTSPDQKEFGRAPASIFSFLDELSRYPEVLPSIGNENATKLQAAINSSSTDHCSF